DLCALLQQHAMITKQRQRRYPGRKRSERRGIVAVLERRSAGLRRCEIGAPRREPVDRRAEERLAEIAWCAIDSRSEIDGVECRRRRERVQPDGALRLMVGIG